MADDELFIKVSKQLQKIAYEMDYQNLDEFLAFLVVKN